MSDELTVVSNVDQMEKISNNNIREVSLETSNDEINKFKIFLVAQAKNELARIVKLTKFLDTVEDRFIEVSTGLMNEYPDNLSIVNEVMKTLTSCLNRSNELVSQIVSDDKLNSFIFKSNEVTSNKTGLTAESRAKVREAALEILNKLNSTEEIK